MPKEKFIQIENKNAILELLEDGRKFERIYLAGNAFKDPKTRRIKDLAGQAGFPVEKVSRRDVKRRSKVSSNESCIGTIKVDNQMSLRDLIDKTHESGKDPFYMILGDIRYPHNIGAIFRTAFSAGVNGIITPIMNGNLLTDEIVRISMGTAVRIPLVEVNLFSAIKEFQKNAIQVIAVDMDQQSLYETELTGPTAFLVGSEDTGVSSKLLEKCNGAVSIPMRPGLGSLNVSVSAAIVMYEKVKQDLGF